MKNFKRELPMFSFYSYTSYNIVTVKGTVASRVFFHLVAEAVRMRE